MIFSVMSFETEHCNKMEIRCVTSIYTYISRFLSVLFHRKGNSNRIAIFPSIFTNVELNKIVFVTLQQEHGDRKNQII